jgi:hypothetical protein
VSSRSFDAPLFGDGTSTTYRLFGSQTLRSGTRLTISGYGGAPSATDLFTFEADEFQLFGGTGRALLGDFSVARVDPEEISTSSGDALALQGGSFSLRRGRSSWNVFVGESKYRIEVADKDPRRPRFAGVGFLHRLQEDYFGFALTAIDRPVYLEENFERDTDAVARGSYYHVLSPWSAMFGDVYGTAEGETGIRAGAHHRFLTGDVSAALYSYGDRFPVAPSVRPGERGVEVGGTYRPSELSTITGQVYWVNQDVLDDRSDLRGHVAFGKSFGSNAPHIHFSYSRDELTFDTLEGDTSRIADHFLFAIGQSSISRYLDLRLEHVMHDGGTEPDRTQAVFNFQQRYAAGYIDANSIVQRDENGDLGATAEAAVEIPFRIDYNVLIGAGAAFVERGSRESGDGVLRLGVTRRVLGNGVYGRLEGRIPFDIGLPSASLNRETFAFEAGVRYGWQDLSDIQGILGPLIHPSQFGSLEGMVELNGQGLGGVPILVNGRRAAITGGDGRYRIARVSIGSISVAIDAGVLDPGYAVVGNARQEIIVRPRQASRADFVLARFSTLQGSLVTCADGAIRGIPGARITLRSGDAAITLETTSSGAFQADDIPPRSYEVVIDPASIAGYASPGEIPALTLDLTEDVLGFVIPVRCNP